MTFDPMADPMTTLPPAWAETVLRGILKPEDRDTVSGDLLEEFRESIVPVYGARANAWYVRQVAGFVLRATWTWAALVASICFARYLLDTLAPIHYTPGVVALRSAVMSWALMSVCSGCGAWFAWRSGHVRAGVLLAVVAAALGGALNVTATLLCLAVAHGPETMAAIHGSGGLDEATWFLVLELMVIGLVPGTAGAIVGRVAGAVYDSSANTKIA